MFLLRARERAPVGAGRRAHCLVFSLARWGDTKSGGGNSARKVHSMEKGKQNDNSCMGMCWHLYNWRVSAPLLCRTFNVLHCTRNLSSQLSTGRTNKAWRLHLHIQKSNYYIFFFNSLAQQCSKLGNFRWNTYIQRGAVSCRKSSLPLDGAPFPRLSDSHLARISYFLWAQTVIRAHGTRALEAGLLIRAVQPALL